MLYMSIDISYPFYKCIYFILYCVSFIHFKTSRTRLMTFLSYTTHMYRVLPYTVESLESLRVSLNLLPTQQLCKDFPSFTGI